MDRQQCTGNIGLCLLGNAERKGRSFRSALDVLIDGVSYDFLPALYDEATFDPAWSRMPLASAA